MSAASAEDFLRDHGGSVDWQTLAQLKSSVDHLIGADLREATRLVERIESLAPHWVMPRRAGPGSCLRSAGIQRQTAFTRVVSNLSRRLGFLLKRPRSRFNKSMR